MRAAVHQQYGPPEVARVMEIPTPEPASGEILIKIMAATVNRTDSGFRSAEYVISRFWSGLLKPKQQTLGCEFAGIVSATGPGCSRFKVGDRVFGYNDKKFGGHAEFLTTSENDCLALIPENLDFDNAACLTEGAHYALCDIRAARVEPGQKVMVYGATGAIGSAAVQILKHYGAEVTAVCNTANTSLVKSLGADRVIDYQTEDFSQCGQIFDFIFDAVGKSSYAACKPLLSTKGIYISTELGKRGVNIWLALTTPLFRGKRLLFPLPVITREDVELIGSWAATGIFKPVIDRAYDLSQIAEAYRYVESGQKTGNVILHPQP